MHRAVPNCNGYRVADPANPGRLKLVYNPRPHQRRRSVRDFAGDDYAGTRAVNEATWDLPVL